MKPIKGSDTINIPITFDNAGTGGRAASSAKPLWLFLMGLFWVVTSIMAFIVADGFGKLVWPFWSFVGLSYVVRFLLLKENTFRKNRQELVENDYMFPHTVFWDIYEISNRKPYIVSFSSGVKAVFVALEKDVIVGKPMDFDYEHHEAIALAYQQMAKRGIECMHIDYMDTVGKDSRLASLFESAEKTENPELRRVIMRKYDYIAGTMNRAYASYDVYAFYYSGKDDIFVDELSVVLNYFLQANYLRSRYLDRDDVGKLVKSLFNLEEFSVNRASDNLFKDLYKTDYLRVIWTEVDGERTQHSMTMEELEESKRVRAAEKSVKRRRRVRSPFNRKGNEEINLFDDNDN